MKAGSFCLEKSIRFFCGPPGAHFSSGEPEARRRRLLTALSLAKLLGEVPGANEGVVSSLCPIHTIEGEAGDPLYGYRPAMSAIVERLKQSL